MRASRVMLLAMIEAYYQKEGNSAGGSLHIVLDDGNTEDCHVEYCLNCAKEKEDADGVILAEQLLLLSAEERDNLFFPDADFS